MRLRVDGDLLVGSALDLRERGVDPERLVASIRDEMQSVDPVHEQVGYIHPDVTFSLESALAAAARSRGETTPYDDALRAVDAALAAPEPPSVDLQADRKRVAAADTDVDELREHVARVSGQVEARRDAGLDATDATARLRDGTRRLSEAETERIAAAQSLTRARAGLRAARDERERRLKLTDRRRNLRRRADHALASAERDRFERAVRGIPGESPPKPLSTPLKLAEFDGARAIAALAVVRLATHHTPVVVADGPFRHAAQARACLRTPVVLV